MQQGYCMSIISPPTSPHCTQQAIWQVGFRPFFILTCFAGAFLPLLWVLVYAGTISLPNPSFDPVVAPTRWHSHEMFFGFGWALLGGFLLTASKNWLGIRGRHGGFLIVLSAFWVLDRIVVAFAASWAPIAIYTSSALFLVTIIAALEFDLIRHHASDSYPDNYYLVLSLPMFIVAKFAMLNNDLDPAIGTSMTMGLFRLAFLVMLERTMPAFMKGAYAIDLTQSGWMRHMIKAIGLALVFSYWLPNTLVTALCLLLSILLVIRILQWHPLKGFMRLDIAVMYIGYLAIVVNLLLIASAPLYSHWMSTASIHVFTLGTIGVIAPAMIVRISNGHTGRKVQFSDWDKLPLYLMIIALVSRVVLPFFLPEKYTMALYVAAGCWFLAFLIIGYRYMPFLMKPRIDGRVH